MVSQKREKNDQAKCFHFKIGPKISKDEKGQGILGWTPHQTTRTSSLIVIFAVFWTASLGNILKVGSHMSDNLKKKLENYTLKVGSDIKESFNFDWIAQKWLVGPFYWQISIWLSYWLLVVKWLKKNGKGNGGCQSWFLGGCDFFLNSTNIHIMG